MFGRKGKLFGYSDLLGLDTFMRDNIKNHRGVIFNENLGFLLLLAFFL